MAYDEYIADRIRQTLKEKKTLFAEKKMFGGIAFMVDDKMLCGILMDKKSGDNLLMVRIGEEAYTREKDKAAVLPMDYTGRPMKGFAFIAPDGFDRDEDLGRWLQLCLDFNPFARASKKRKKKN